MGCTKAYTKNSVLSTIIRKSLGAIYKFIYKPHIFIYMW